jgi:uncharacterized protein
MDPLAELVKLDPKSIGVGQYQHDVDQTALKRSLDDVVVSCVNSVGVEVNTASKNLLSYVAGLNSRTAASIVGYRDENGPFKSRKELQKVPGLGPKSFEQAAGFLRIRGGDHPLDASAVHPERYTLIDQMAKDLGCTVEELVRDLLPPQEADVGGLVLERRLKVNAYCLLACSFSTFMHMKQPHARERFILRVVHTSHPMCRFGMLCTTACVQ